MNSNIIYEEWDTKIQNINNNIAKDKNWGMTEQSMELFQNKKFKEFMLSKHICWYQDPEALLWYGLEPKKARCIYDATHKWSGCSNCRDFQLQRKIKLLGQIVPDIVQFEIWKCLTTDEIHFCKFCKQPKKSSTSTCNVCWN